MHEKGFVHGDIRNWNMLHPLGDDGNSERKSITKSQLIDFDFSGEAGTCRYPPGFSRWVPDNMRTRVGKAGCRIEKVDDWKELGSALAKYKVTATEEVCSRAAKDGIKDREAAQYCQNKLQELMKAMYNGKLNCPMDAIKKFIEEWGDCKLFLELMETEHWDEAIKGNMI